MRDPPAGPSERQVIAAERTTIWPVGNLSFAYSGVATGTAIHSEGSYSHFNDFLVDVAGIGVYLKTGVAQKLTNFDILNFETAGLVCESLNDPFVSKFIINAGNQTRGTLGGIRLINKVEAFVASDGDVINGVYGMTTTAASYTLGNRPAYNKFSNVYFDSAANGVSIDQAVEFDFTSCWFSNRPIMASFYKTATASGLWAAGKSIAN